MFFVVLDEFKILAGIGRYGWRTQTRTEELSQIYHFNLSVQSMTCNISLKSQENADSESSELNNKLTKSFKIIINPTPVFILATVT